MGIQINGQTDTISATDGSFTISGASGNLTGNLTGNVTGDVTGNLTGTASTATAAATAYGLSGSPTLSGITSVSTSNLTVNGNAYPATGPLSNRNLIINGAMQVAQRGTQVTSVTSSGYRTCDRFKVNMSNLGTWTIDQSGDSPDGFSSSFKMTCTTADASPAANDNIFCVHQIEAQNLQSLAFGTSGAQATTLSFWVRSNKTGNASFAILQNDNSNKLASFQYSISSADTWEQKTITIPADTAGVINNDNGEGLQLEWWLNGGSTFTGGSHQATWSTFNNANRNVSNLGLGGATSDYWQITGVQLEVGQVATPFEHRSYGDELAKCQRYFQQLSNCELVGSKNTSTRMRINGKLLVEMRTPPTVTRTSTSLGFQDVGATKTSTNTSAAQATTQGVRYMAFDIDGFTSLADRSYGGADSHGNGPVFNCDAEL